MGPHEPASASNSSILRRVCCVCAVMSDSAAFGTSQTCRCARKKYGKAQKVTVAGTIVQGTSLGCDWSVGPWVRGSTQPVVPAKGRGFRSSSPFRLVCFSSASVKQTLVSGQQLTCAVAMVHGSCKSRTPLTTDLAAYRDNPVPDNDR